LAALIWLLLVFREQSPAGPLSPSEYFGIRVVDDQSERGVPMVELKTTSSACYYTDSAGWVAFYEPGLMNRKVYFAITSHGYEFPKDGFGNAGVALETKPGTTRQLKIRRLNIAERFYRITGQGIYRDSILLGLSAPIKQPLLNAQITGQDGVLNAIYGGRLYWFYGDTSRASYALGNYSMTGATSDLPEKIDPAAGINLTYFTGPDGFARAMAPVKGEGVVWLSGVVVLPDETGRERMLAFYQRRKGLGPLLEQGFMVYNGSKNEFEKVKTISMEESMYPRGYPFRSHGTNGADYIYFTAPYPALRVKATWETYLDPSAYEAFTCLPRETLRQEKAEPELERDSSGRLAWRWKRHTALLSPRQQQQLVKSGKMTRHESPFRLEDAATANPVLLSNSSCFWNDYKKCYIMIASEAMGATVLGEVWYSEAPSPEGPWVKGRKIITHANKAGDAHDFYNPTQHPFFDQEGGRIIYLEGSYVNTFSGNPQTTPYYEYNQIMYRLDLGDSRLKF
jgi:hypothetical protein